MNELPTMPACPKCGALDVSTDIRRWFCECGWSEPICMRITIEPGRSVVCDGCSKDFTDSPESGGVYGLMTKAFGPCCAASILAKAKQYGEEQYIRARCPPGKSFADWVREDLR